MNEHPNRTKIVATLGPASRHPDVIQELIRAGADCFRINFSHVSEPGDAQQLIDMVRRASAEEGVHIPILADIQGPKLRMGKLPSDGLMLLQAQPFTLRGPDAEATDDGAPCQYELLADDVSPGTTILLADGTIELTVSAVNGRDVVCDVVNGGRLYSNKGLNIPRTKLSVETLTEKDARDLAWIAQSDVDMVAISFVRTAKDIIDARLMLGDRSRIPVMAKLELPEVLDNLDDILGASDGVMVARGDLGVEVPFEQVPGLQKRILRRAAARGKWSLVATQMLGSMVLQPRPTRAEVSDVANAILDGTDAIMLSEETAAGSHPLEAVQAMERICAEAEAMKSEQTDGTEHDITSFSAGAANAAVSAARRLKATAIVTLAGSGLTALAVSKWRPEVPILALSMNGHTLRRLNVLRGVVPVALPNRMDMEAQMAVVDRFLLDNGWAKPGEITVAVAAMPLGEGKETNTIRLHRVRG